MNHHQSHLFAFNNLFMQTTIDSIYKRKNGNKKPNKWIQFQRFLDSFLCRKFLNYSTEDIIDISAEIRLSDHAELFVNWYHRNELVCVRRRRNAVLCVMQEDRCGRMWLMDVTSARVFSKPYQCMMLILSSTSDERIFYVISRLLLLSFRIFNL